jgi:hypothetical protein
VGRNKEPRTATARFKISSATQDGVLVELPKYAVLDNRLDTDKEYIQYVYSVHASCCVAYVVWGNGERFGATAKGPRDGRTKGPSVPGMSEGPVSQVIFTYTKYLLRTHATIPSAAKLRLFLCGA